MEACRRRLRRPGGRRSESVGRSPVAVVPARKYGVQLAKDLLQIIGAGPVAKVIADEGPLCIRITFPEPRQLVLRVVDRDVVHGCGGKRQTNGLATPPPRIDLNQRYALVIEAFAEVEPFDAPRVTDVRQAFETLGLVDVAQRDIGVVRG